MTTEPSHDAEPRLRRLLRDYVYQGDPDGFPALAKDLAAGGLPWFPDAFAATLRAGVFTAAWWGRNVYDDTFDQDDWSTVEQELRAVWSAAWPGHPFPQLAPGASATPDA